MSAQSTTNIRVMAMTPDALTSCLRVAKAWRARRDTVGGVRVIFKSRHRAHGAAGALP
jgi:hypothetical protein